MNHKVLLVDDDPHVLEAFQRALRHRFDMVTAGNTAQALKVLTDKGPFAVMVADMRMPGLDGLELLRLVQEMDPDMIRIMLTGNADQKTAMDAINDGQVFRFLIKPCPADTLAMALEAGIRQHQLLVIERELMEKTLQGAVEMLKDLIYCQHPEAFNRSQALQQHATRLARAMKAEKPWEIRLAAQLAFIGELTLSPALLAKAQGHAPLTDIERQQMESIPALGESLLSRIPRLEGVAHIVRYQAKGYDGSGMPQDEVKGVAIPLGARILKPLLDLAKEGHSLSQHPEVARERLKVHAHLYDPEVIKHLLDHTPRDQQAVRTCLAEELTRHMVLVDPLTTKSGQVIFHKGVRLEFTHLLLIKNLKALMDLQEPIRVHPPCEDAH